MSISYSSSRPPSPEQFAELGRLPEFQGLSTAEIEQLLNVMKEKIVAVDRIFFEEGSPADSLYLLVEGTVEVRKVDRVLAKLEAPSVFGEVGFLTGGAHTASVRAVGAARILRLERGDFDAAAKRGALAPYKLALNVARRLADRLRKTDDWLVELLTKSEKSKELQSFRNKLLKEWQF